MGFTWGFCLEEAGRGGSPQVMQSQAHPGGTTGTALVLVPAGCKSRDPLELTGTPVWETLSKQRPLRFLC